MKKHLLIALALCIGLTSFAAPWDLKSPHHKLAAPMKPMKVVYDDPYVTLYQAFESNYGNLSHKMTLYAELDHSAGYPYKVTIEVSGVWWVGGAAFKYYDVMLTSSQWYKFQEFTLHPYDQPAITTINLVYSGPA